MTCCQERPRWEVNSHKDLKEMRIRVLSTWYTSRIRDTAVNTKNFFPREAYRLAKELNHKQINKYKLMSCDNHQEEK